MNDHPGKTFREMAQEILEVATHLAECDFDPAMSPYRSCPDCRMARARLEEYHRWVNAEKMREASIEESRGL